YLLMWITQV
nr:Chain c, NY-ESO1 DOUBLE MUTANT (1Y, 9V) [synthetic construct]4L29_e Chain e, NY-ESO1 DOUBLE MUTANT (1Y, 9V) [synthetic construct]4L29_f Chain f, NY-ESO1 DOUBLE MUTANT (1Y, 9V) [synthetic construct]4L29_g Chain g, NY-ESO1 DOUBLE MUTANT (1Y, 9V) [synthetic construct]4L29_h Chain h, NY-ESO1 DOUBLE MUTANT (1Y, 9V) [synthetic construct]4L29_i Chain i, NY-ESO1 DOUBLE MUTANT (1Y, 9V) [synthetic construct]4L29_j Chain j, NY-ESO1 DOUBLE MUTANT (1Y, 9V) [synthetic construct]4L29_k Chain k, NY-ESO1 